MLRKSSIALRLAAMVALLAGTLALTGCFGGGGGTSLYGRIDGYVYQQIDARGTGGGDTAKPKVIVTRSSKAPEGYLPLEGAKVVAVQAGKIKITYSNSQGYFVLTMLDPGRYDVSITHERFINGLTYPDVQVVAGRTTHIGDAKLGSFFYLIIGINDYPESYNDLHYAVADAELLEYTLWGMNGYAGEVVRLTDADAERADILAAIQAIGAKMSPDGQDYFVMTFSGHGGSTGDPNPDPGDPPNEFLVASDGKFIYDNELQQWIAACIPASPVTGTRYCIFVFDSCRSGGMVKALNTSADASTPEWMKNFKPGLSRMARNLSAAGYVVLMACDDTEYSYESTTLQNGVFTEFLCEGIATRQADSNHDGLITAKEVFDYAGPRVGDYVSNHPGEFGPDAVQTPQLFASPRELENVPIYRTP